MTTEYLISFIVFIGLIGYIYISYSSNIPAYLLDVRKETRRSRTYQLSELLINTPGEPENWYQLTIDQIKRIGLLDENLNRQNLISYNKTERLDEDFSCSTEASYNQLRKKLGMENEYFSIIISEIDSNGDRNLLYACISPSTVVGPVNTTVTRIVTFNDTRSIQSGILNTAELIIRI
jgi:hypothetical protein